MAVLFLLERFLLCSALVKAVLGPVVTTDAAVLLLLPADPRPSPLFAVRILNTLFVACGTWCGVRCSELERAGSEAHSRDFENQLRDLIFTVRNESIAATEYAEEAAIAALLSSLCGIEAQIASADLAAASTALANLALLERQGLTAELAELAEELNDWDQLP